MGTIRGRLEAEPDAMAEIGVRSYLRHLLLRGVAVIRRLRAIRFVAPDGALMSRIHTSQR
jgi:hypothetical protein